jgi:hypothetical protein
MVSAFFGSRIILAEFSSSKPWEFSNKHAVHCRCDIFLDNFLALSEEDARETIGSWCFVGRHGMYRGLDLLLREWNL